MDFTETGCKGERLMELVQNLVPLAVLNLQVLLPGGGGRVSFLVNGA
jgi:hypothetical protein